MNNKNLKEVQGKPSDKKWLKKCFSFENKKRGYDILAFLLNATWKENKEGMWSVIWTLIGTVGLELMVFKWIYSDIFEEYPKVGKWVDGFIIAVVMICVLGIVFAIIRLPKLRDEIETLKIKE